jgi:hypothetical protein
MDDDGIYEGGGSGGSGVGDIIKDQIWYDMPIWLLSINLVLPILAVIYGVLSWIFVSKYKNKPIVAMGQPTFLYSICAGAILIASCMLFNIPVVVNGIIRGGDGSVTSIGLDVCCNLMVWASYLGYYFVYTALLCKMYRIILITEEPLRRGLMILPKHVMGPYIIVMILVISLLIAWSATDPHQFVVERMENDVKYTGNCKLVSAEHTVGIALVSTMADTIVEIALLIMAWKIRHVNRELGDSKRIFKMLFFLLFTHVVFGILIFTSPLWKLRPSLLPSIQTLVYIIRFSIDSVAIISFLILPRIYYVWYEHKHGHLPENVVMIGRGTTSVRVNNEQ